MKTITLLFAICFTTATFAQNNSLHFDGSDDYVDLDNVFAFNHDDAFSVEAWIKFGEPGVKQIISKLGNENNSFRGWGFQINSAGFLSGYVIDRWLVNMRFVRGTNTLFDDNWHHVAMTFDGADRIRLYVDGNIEPIGFEDNPGVMADIQTASSTHIGNYDGGGNQGEYWKGNIDDLRIWDNVRTETEISTNYLTELTGNEPGLLGYYKMDEAQTTCDVIDCSPNEYHGSRMGNGGTNNMPQFDEETPTITDVACGTNPMCEVLGIGDLSSSSILTISPNPANDILQFSGVQLVNPVATIYNMLGHQIVSQAVENGQINLTTLPSGIYFVSVKDAEQVYVKKFIKQ